MSRAIDAPGRSPSVIHFTVFTCEIKYFVGYLYLPGWENFRIKFFVTLEIGCVKDQQCHFPAMGV